jgi:ABC-type oligopeptide transport system substrate-binding subunit
MIDAAKDNTAKEAAAQYNPRLERVLSASFAITPAAYSPVTLRVSRWWSGSIGNGPT